MERQEFVKRVTVLGEELRQIVEEACKGKETLGDPRSSVLYSAIQLIKESAMPGDGLL
jgi:4-aminobutyrate aminotransferase-like enzyme